MIAALSVISVFIVSIFLYMTPGGKKMLDKKSIFRFRPILENLITLGKNGFPLQEFASTTNSANNPNILLSEIGRHYKLDCSFQLRIHKNLGEISDERYIAANIEIFPNIPNPKSKEFGNYVFNVNLREDVASGNVDLLKVVLGHEVAHAYLHSYKLSGYKTELMTDICAMSAGFYNNYEKINNLREIKEGNLVETFLEDQKKGINGSGNYYISKWEIAFVRYIIVNFKNFINTLKGKTK